MQLFIFLLFVISPCEKVGEIFFFLTIWRLNIDWLVYKFPLGSPRSKGRGTPSRLAEGEIK